MSHSLIFTLWSLFNRASLAWRRWIFRPRSGLCLPDEPWETLFPEGTELSREAERLRSLYHLDWSDAHANQRENLHVLSLLEAALGPVAEHFPPTLDVLDIGAKDWHYLPGLVRFLRHARAPEPRATRVTGLEADPYHRYRDGFTRYDYAQRYAQGLQARYQVGDSRKHGGSHDLVLLLYPFWREREVLDWGLPGAYFDASGMVRHARSRLKEGGLLLVTAYASEREWATETLGLLGWEARVTGEWRSPFVGAGSSVFWVFQG